MEKQAYRSSMELGGLGGACEPLSGTFRGQITLRTFQGSNEHLDWFKIDMNLAEIITVQDYK